ncbi:MAG: PAS domain-containing protein, partial [Chitinivibrionales bacterium]|nr:PAS domain-containing protein [Chitinivibrionales bacterium]
MIYFSGPKWMNRKYACTCIKILSISFSGVCMKQMSFIQPKTFRYAAWSLGVLIVLFLLSLDNNILSGSLAETFCIAIALGMFMIAWHTREYSKNRFLLYLGIVYFFVGTLDILYMFASSEVNIFRGDETSVAIQSRLAARFLHAFSLIVAPFFLKRNLKNSIALHLYPVIGLLLIVSIIWGEFLPRLFVEPSGFTLFKKISAYVIPGLFAGALIVLYRYRLSIKVMTFRLIAASIVLMILAELSFTLASNTYRLVELWGFFFKGVAFYLTYRAIIAGTLERPYNILYRDLTSKNDELYASEEQFRSLFELSGVGKADADLATDRFIRVNRRLCEITGYSEEELKNMTYADLAHPDDRVKNKKKTGPQFKADKKRWNTERRYIRKDGAEIWVAIYGAIICNSKGRPYRSIADIVDITERKAVEERLRFQANVLRQVEEAVILVDNEQIISYMNHRAGEEYDMDPGDAVGRNLAELYKYHWIYPDNEDCVQQALQDSGRWEGEIIHIKRNGKKIYVHSVKSVVKNEEEKTIGILSVMHNVTARKEAELKVASIARFPEENPYPVIRITKNGIVAYANAAAVPMLEEWGGKAGGMLNTSRHCRSLLQAIESGSLQEVEIRYSDRWCSLTVVPFSDQGYVNIYGRDVTETKAAQEALRISEQRYALAQRVANIGTWDWHIGSGVIHWSEQIEPLFGLEKGAFEGTYDSFLSLVHPEDRPMVSDAMNASINTGKEYKVEHRIVDTDGTVRWMQEIGAVLHSIDGSPERMIGITTDVTQVHKTKEELETKVEIQANELANTIVSLEHVSEQKNEAEENFTHRQRALEAVYAMVTAFDFSIKTIHELVVLNITNIIKAQSVVIYQFHDDKAINLTRCRDGVLYHE